MGEQLNKMRVFLTALEGSLDREAERVRSDAGLALRRELGGLNSYLEQLRQMEQVLDEVADKPQTEFLMVSPVGSLPHAFPHALDSRQTIYWQTITLRLICTQDSSEVFETEHCRRPQLSGHVTAHSDLLTCGICVLGRGIL